MPLYLSGFLILSGLPDSSYYAAIYNSGFSQVSNNNLNTFVAGTETYSIYLSGLIDNGPTIYDMLILKNNWVCARTFITGINATGYYNLV